MKHTVCIRIIMYYHFAVNTNRLQCIADRYELVPVELNVTRHIEKQLDWDKTRE